MGIFDNFSNTLSDAIDRGTTATSRTARTLKLRAKLGEVNKNRSDFAAQLGASLYEETKDVPSFVAGRESLYQGIASCDVERAQIQTELSQIEEEAAAEASSRKTYTCQSCGTHVKDSDSFCAGCGRPVADIKAEAKAAAEAEQAQARAAADAAAATLICPNCGSVVGDNDKFCVSCGKPIDRESAVAEGTPSNPIVEPVGDSSSVEAIVEPEDTQTANKNAEESQAPASSKDVSADADSSADTAKAGE